MSDKLTKCPHCGHEGGGLQYAIPGDSFNGLWFSKVQAACLSCGIHGPYRQTEEDAAGAFMRGEIEHAEIGP